MAFVIHIGTPARSPFAEPDGSRAGRVLGSSLEPLMGAAPKSLLLDRYMIRRAIAPLLLCPLALRRAGPAAPSKRALQSLHGCGTPGGIFSVQLMKRFSRSVRYSRVASECPWNQ